MTTTARVECDHPNRRNTPIFQQTTWTRGGTPDESHDAWRAHVPDREPREPILTELKEYWRAIRGELPIARRNDVDPADLIFILPNLMLVETAKEIGDYRIRLFATGLVKEFGEERTGKRFGELRDIENLQEAYGDFGYVRRTAKPSYIGDRSVSPLRSYRGYSRLLLPLTLQGETVDIILAGYAFT